MQKKKISISLPLIIAIVIILIVLILVIRSCSRNISTDENNIAKAQTVEKNEIEDFVQQFVGYVLENDYRNIESSIDFNGYFSYMITNEKDSFLSGKVDDVKLSSNRLNFEKIYAYCSSFDENGFEETVEKYKDMYKSSEEYNIEQEMDIFKGAVSEATYKTEDSIIKALYENYDKEIKIKKISNATKSNLADYIYKIDVGIDMTYYNNNEEKKYKGTDTIHLIKINDRYFVIYSEWLQKILENDGITLSKVLETM